MQIYLLDGRHYICRGGVLRKAAKFSQGDKYVLRGSPRRWHIAIADSSQGKAGEWVDEAVSQVFSVDGGVPAAHIKKEAQHNAWRQYADAGYDAFAEYQGQVEAIAGNIKIYKRLYDKVNARRKNAKASEMRQIDETSFALLQQIKDKKDELLPIFQKMRSRLIDPKVKAAGLDIKTSRSIPADRAEQLQTAADEFYGLAGEKANKIGALTIRKTKEARAYADYEKREINVGSQAKKDSSERKAQDDKFTLFHELGHFLERSHPDILQSSLGFIASRSRSDTPKKLSEIVPGTAFYDEDEVAYEGNFITPYAGKVYGDFATEVISIGVEPFAHERSMMNFYLEDEGHFMLILGVLSHV